MSLPRSILPGTTYLLTRRCIGRRFLLRPDDRMNNIFVYCLARAAEKYGVELHAVVTMSNHYHLVLTDVRGVLPDFTAWLNRTLAMCVKRLRGWDEVVWEPNVACSAVELTGSSEVLDKVAYAILNPVSAGLVPRPASWPGTVTTTRTLRHGSLHANRPGVWFKRHAPATATLRLTEPPCFADRDGYYDALGALLRSRLRQLETRMRERGKQCLGRRGVMKTASSDRPATDKQRFGRSPIFSALTRSRWLAAVEKLREFRAAYRTAYDAWRQGRRDVEFPLGTWWLVRRAGVSIASERRRAPI